MFGDIYENILRDLQSAGNYGEFYCGIAGTFAPVVCEE